MRAPSIQLARPVTAVHSNDVDAKSLSDALGVSINTAKTRMKMLERYGWIEARGSFGKTVFRPNSVKSSIDRLYEVDRP
jgi:DNA-binding transcriptional MocR family regulator